MKDEVYLRESHYQNIERYYNSFIRFDVDYYFTLDQIRILEFYLSNQVDLSSYKKVKDILNLSKLYLFFLKGL